MADAYSTAAENGPPGQGSRARPVSQTLPTGTVAPVGRADVSGDKAPVQGHTSIELPVLCLESPQGSIRSSEEDALERWPGES